MMSEDPLRALDASILRARDLAAPVAVAQVQGADALERVRALMARAGAQLPAPTLPPALAALIAQARALPAAAPLPASSATPLAAMASAIRAERDALGARGEPLGARIQTPAPAPAPGAPASAAPASSAPPGADRMALELLAALGSAPLSGEVRAAVAQALIDAMERPDAEALRAILRMVVLNTR
jgi:hypothetical protein